MMYKLILIISICILYSCAEETPEEVLKKSKVAVANIKYGTYEMQEDMKNMFYKDTNTFYKKHFFIKMPDDTIHKAYYASEYKTDSTNYRLSSIYNGKESINIYSDSTVKIATKLDHPDYFKRLHSYFFFEPFVRPDQTYHYRDSAWEDIHFELKDVTKDNVHGKSCYKYHFNVISQKESEYETIKSTYTLWINREDYLPIKTSSYYLTSMDGDTVDQYNVRTLLSYNTEKVDEKMFTKSMIPNNYTIQEYVPRKSPDLLKKGEKAPDWNLVDINDRKHKLSDFKGKLRLVDFYYRACYGCILAIPGLEVLNKKYSDKGLKVIGLNVRDTKKELIPFLDVRDVTYQNFIDADSVAKKYNVSAYPTIYLIDEEGKILKTKVGYSEESEKELEEFIAKYLNKQAL